MIPQYLNPLGFVDKPNETGATFILTNPKESEDPGTRHSGHDLEILPGTPGTGQNPRRDNQGGLHHRSLHNHRARNRPQMARGPRDPQGEDPGVPGTKRLIRARYEPDAHPGQTAAIAEHARRCPDLSNKHRIACPRPARNLTNTNYPD